MKVPTHLNRQRASHHLQGFGGYVLGLRVLGVIMGPGEQRGVAGRYLHEGRTSEVVCTLLSVSLAVADRFFDVYLTRDA